MARHRILRYMARFQCRGPECEATCCGAGWSIFVDEPHYLELQQAMSHTEADRDLFAANVQPVRGTPSPHGHAQMVIDQHGQCSFLDADGLCGIQRRFGEPALPNSCSIYPRKISMAAKQLEVAGLLSCPEVARQLYAGPDSTTVDRLDARTVRHRVTQLVPAGATDPYDQVIDDVRATVVELLQTPGYRLASRLFFVSFFAETTREVFHRGAGPEATDALAAAIAEASDEETLASWHRAFASLEVTTALAGQVIAGALKDRVEDAAGYAPFAELVRACFANVGVDAEGETTRLDPAAIWAAYLERRAGRDTEAIDGMLTSYAIDFWLKEYYTESPDLAAHATKLIVRLALLRFLLFTHPGFDEGDPARTLVEVTYKLARAVEHDHDFTDGLERLLPRLGITSLAHAMFLMKV